MSIQNEIERINLNISNSYSAVQEMGGDIPEIQDSNNLADAIRSIPTGIGFVTVESITITTPPLKTQYFAGESFDPTGMEVSATFSNGQIMPVSILSLTFDPSGSLDGGEESVTVNFQWGLKTVSAYQAISVFSGYWLSPHMTNHTTPYPYIASASNEKTNESLYAWQAFDGIQATGAGNAGGKWSTPDNPGYGWVQIDFGKAVAIDALRVNPIYSMPANTFVISTPNWFYLKGSMDGENFDLIKEWSDISWASIGQYSDFFLDEISEYRFYRIGADNVKSSDSFNGRVGYGDIQFHRVPSENNN